MISLSLRNDELVNRLIDVNPIRIPHWHYAGGGCFLFNSLCELTFLLIFILDAQAVRPYNLLHATRDERRVTFDQKNPRYSFEQQGNSYILMTDIK